MNCGTIVDNKTVADALAVTLAGMPNASAAGPWDVENMARVAHTFMMAISSLQNLAAAHGTAPAAPLPMPEPVHVPAPLVAEPEPQLLPTPAPEPEHEPLRVDVPEMPSPRAREAVWIFEEDEKHVESPAPEPERAFEPVPQPEPDRTPQSVPLPTRKRYFEQVSDDEEVKDAGPIARVLSPPASPRPVQAGGDDVFGSFRRQTMNFHSVSNIVAPKTMPKLPPVIVMTRAECEEKIRELEAIFKVGLSRPEILSMRSSVATAKGYIKKLKMQIAEREAEATVGEQLEEVFQYCDTLRQLAASRAVKRAVLSTFRMQA